MSAPTADRIVHDAHIGPDDTPHEAAAHLWAQVVANHDVDPGGPLGRLGVFDRVVLVLHDVLGLSPSTVAEVLHTDEAVVTSAHAAARTRAGLPSSGPGDCDAWQDVRDAHDPGDPAVLTALAVHANDCPTCRGTVADDQHRMHRGWLRRGVGVSTAGAAAVAAPALGGTLAAAAAIVTAGVAVGALVGPVPEPPPPEPVVVDADPGLPSDEQPVDGWPAQRPSADDTASNEADEDSGGTDATTDVGDAPQGDADQVEEPTGPLDDTVDDVTDSLDETLDDATDAVQDTVDDATDTVTDTTDEVTDTVDETTGGATDELSDTVDETTSDAGDAVDDLVEDGSDALP